MRHRQLPAAVLEVFQSADPGRLAAACGLAENRVREVARQLGESDAPLVLAGASTLQTNSFHAVVASHYINQMLGNIGNRGGVLPPPPPAMSAPGDHRAAAALARARFVLLDDVNPAYTLPQASGAIDALGRADFVISFAGFLDDSAAWADLLLPVHHALESEGAVVPAVSPQSGFAIATPFVRPLYQTRSLEQILSELAQRLKLTFRPATVKEVVQPLLTEESSFSDAARQGGVWQHDDDTTPVRIASQAPHFAQAAFDGDPARYPLYFQPYVSLQFHEGRGANLPWMQELPDPASSAIWGLPVEIDAKTASDLRIANGDRVRIESAHGAIEAPAYIHPGAIPGVVSMAIGDGHTHYGRYASGRGANPLSILAPVWENATGALVLGGTRVRLARAGGPQGWIQFAAPAREERDFGTR
jgi:anaerobic selenocysteine-containing dehydrogenase